MFTGLVETVGRVRSVSAESGGVTRLTIHAPDMRRLPGLGDSVCVSGVCLTAVDVRGDVFSAQAMAETQRASKLGRIKAGDSVNLESSLRPEDGLHGHFVLGHVDEAGRVIRVERAGSTRKIWASVSEDIAWGIASKGSIALDGVSLTVIDSHETEFSVGIIPATLEGTTLGLLEAGDWINVEVDVLARYAARLLGPKAEEARRRRGTGGALTFEKLAKYGWL